MIDLRALLTCALALGCSARAEPDPNPSAPIASGGSVESSGGSAPMRAPSGGSGGGISLDLSTPPAAGGGGDAQGNPLRPPCDKADPCACIRVGTLGFTGTWGDGNLFDSWLTAAGDAFENLGDVKLTAESLGRVQILIVQDVHNNCNSAACGSLPVHYYSDDEVQALQDWVRAGNGLFALMGYFGAGHIEVQNVNRLLAPSGIHYDSGDILPGDPTIPVATWNELDATRVVTDGISAVGVNNGRAVLGDPPALALGPGGEVVLRATQLGKGHVVVWGDEWITYDAEWRKTSQYQVGKFWQNVMTYLTPQPECAPPIPPEIIVK